MLKTGNKSRLNVKITNGIFNRKPRTISGGEDDMTVYFRLTFTFLVGILNHLYITMIAIAVSVTMVASRRAYCLQILF